MQISTRFSHNKKSNNFFHKLLSCLLLSIIHHLWIFHWNYRKCTDKSRKINENLKFQWNKSLLFKLMPQMHLNNQYKKKVMYKSNSKIFSTNCTQFSIFIVDLLHLSRTISIVFPHISLLRKVMIEICIIFMNDFKLNFFLLFSNIWMDLYKISTIGTFFYNFITFDSGLIWYFSRCMWIVYLTKKSLFYNNI